MRDYDDLKAKLKDLRASGRIPVTSTREQRIDFAYGNTRLENDVITREMCADAVDAADMANARPKGEN